MQYKLIIQGRLLGVTQVIHAFDMCKHSVNLQELPL